MTQDVKHSPLPWRVWGSEIEALDPHDFDDLVIGTLGVTSGCRSAIHSVAKSKQAIEANAQFIVTACNSHYENLKTIAVLKEALEKIVAPFDGFDEVQMERRTSAQGHTHGIKVARAALAKVKP